MSESEHFIIGICQNRDMSESKSVGTSRKCQNCSKCEFFWTISYIAALELAQISECPHFRHGNNHIYSLSNSQTNVFPEFWFGIDIAHLDSSKLRFRQILT